MASPQLERGYTRIANEILEALFKFNLTGTQSKIVWFVIRHSYGFGRRDVEIKSLRGLAMTLEQDHRGVTKAFNLLIREGVLTHVKDDLYRLNKDYERWGQEFPGTGVDKTGDRSSHTRGQEFPLINKVVKETTKERKKTTAAPSPGKPLTPVQRVVEAFKKLNGIEQFDKDFNKTEYPHFARRAKELLAKFNGDVNKSLDCMEWVWNDLAEGKGLTVNLETVIKHSWRFKKEVLNQGGKG